MKFNERLPEDFFCFLDTRDLRTARRQEAVFAVLSVEEVPEIVKGRRRSGAMNHSVAVRTNNCKVIFRRKPHRLMVIKLREWDQMMRLNIVSSDGPIRCFKVESTHLAGI